MAKSKTAVNRRRFLEGAATAAGRRRRPRHPHSCCLGRRGAASRREPCREGAAPAPTAARSRRDGGDVRPPATAGPAQRAVIRPGSDLMVQVLRDLGIEYIAGNPGSSFEGLQESIINYGNPPNRMPEFITALHEESAVTMAHGYGRRPASRCAALLHGTIGVQHAAMSIYQAYYDRTPVAARSPGATWASSRPTARTTWPAWCAASRSGTRSRRRSRRSLVAIQRAYNEAITPPMRSNAGRRSTSSMQKEEARDMKVPAYASAADHRCRLDGSAREIAEGACSMRRIRGSRSAVCVTPEGVKLAVQLAELVGASTSTAATQGPMSFPQRHPLCGPGASTAYDYTLGLEADGAQVSLVGPGLSTLLGRDPANIGFGGIAPGAGGRRAAARRERPLRIEVDAEASLPAIHRRSAATDDAGQAARSCRSGSAKHADGQPEGANRGAAAARSNRSSAGWDASPVSTARIYAELWPLIMHEDWCLSSPSSFSGRAQHAAVGSQQAAQLPRWTGRRGHGLRRACVCRRRARGEEPAASIVINVQTDGDLNYAPGVLWTARPSPAADADDDAQQPRVASGADVCRVHVRRPRPRRRSRPHRHDAARSVHRLPDDGGRIRDGRRRADHRSVEAVGRR
mgnify:CR=1 FL=1